MLKNVVGSLKVVLPTNSVSLKSVTCHMMVCCYARLVPSAQVHLPSQVYA